MHPNQGAIYTAPLEALLAGDMCEYRRLVRLAELDNLYGRPYPHSLHNSWCTCHADFGDDAGCLIHGVMDAVLTARRAGARRRVTR